MDNQDIICIKIFGCPLVALGIWLPFVPFFGINSAVDLENPSLASIINNYGFFRNCNLLNIYVKGDQTVYLTILGPDLTQIFLVRKNGKAV